MREIDRATRSKTEVILSINSLFIASRVVSPAVGVQYAVAKIIVSRGVELVGAGLHSEADDAVTGFAVLGREITLKYLKLLDCVGRNAFVPLRVRRN